MTTAQHSLLGKAFKPMIKVLSTTKVINELCHTSLKGWGLLFRNVIKTKGPVHNTTACKISNSIKGRPFLTSWLPISFSWRALLLEGLYFVISKMHFLYRNKPRCSIFTVLISNAVAHPTRAPLLLHFNQIHSVLRWIQIDANYLIDEQPTFFKWWRWLKLI
jgi:hypothetical protein